LRKRLRDERGVGAVTDALIPDCPLAWRLRSPSNSSPLHPRDISIIIIINITVMISIIIIILIIILIGSISVIIIIGSGVRALRVANRRGTRLQGARGAVADGRCP
jgi:hypothetical protein